MSQVVYILLTLAASANGQDGVAAPGHLQTCTSLLVKHPYDAYSGVYTLKESWGGLPHWEKAGYHHYWYPASGPDGGKPGWSFSSTDQSSLDTPGLSDYWEGGYMPQGQKVDWGYATCFPKCVLNWKGIEGPADKVTISCQDTQERKVCTSLEVSEHPMGSYKGTYTLSEPWNGKPHFESAVGNHLYWYAGLPVPAWSFDHNDQSQLDEPGSKDLYNGGFLTMESRGQVDGGFSCCSPCTLRAWIDESGPATDVVINCLATTFNESRTTDDCRAPPSASGAKPIAYLGITAVLLAAVMQP